MLTAPNTYLVPLVHLLHSYMIGFFILDSFLESYLMYDSEIEEIEPYECSLVVTVDIFYVGQHFTMWWTNFPQVFLT